MNVNINGKPFFRQTADFHGIDSVHTTPHTGVDLATYVGTPLPSASDGVVTQVYRLGNQNVGNGIKVETPDGTEVIYGHLDSISVKVGDHVQLGDIIGTTGNSGFSTGPHLHLGAKSGGQFIDPQPFVDALQSLAHTLLDAGWATVQLILLFIGG